MQRDLDANNLGYFEDWFGDSIALTCPACKKVFIVSAQLAGGQRTCPKCGKSKGIVTGSKESRGTATVLWS